MNSVVNSKHAFEYDCTFKPRKKLLNIYVPMAKENMKLQKYTQMFCSLQKKAYIKKYKRLQCYEQF